MYSPVIHRSFFTSKIDKWWEWWCLFPFIIPAFHIHYFSCQSAATSCHKWSSMIRCQWWTIVWSTCISRFFEDGTVKPEKCLIYLRILWWFPYFDYKERANRKLNWINYVRQALCSDTPKQSKTFEVWPNLYVPQAGFKPDVLCQTAYQQDV